TEAGSGGCYVKFAATPPGPRGPARLERLLAACEVFAGARGCAALVAGVSMGRESAYRGLRACGFRTILQGVTMHPPSTPPYHDPGAFVLDDWRRTPPIRGPRRPFIEPPGQIGWVPVAPGVPAMAVMAAAETPHRAPRRMTTWPSSRPPPRT